MEKLSDYMEWDVDKNGCWNCTSHAGVSGWYPKLTFRGKYEHAHRVSYMIHNGKIPRKKVIRHKCDNPVCINPDHLLIGTYADNSKDMVARGRSTHGSKNRHAKLVESQVVEIIKNKEMTAKQLAAKYGVSVKTIRSIRSGRTWKRLISKSNLQGLIIKKTQRRMTEAEVTEILKTNDKTDEEIARIYGVYGSTVTNIKNGTCWSKFAKANGLESYIRPKRKAKDIA